MPVKVEINGQIVEFDNKPSESDIDEAAKSLKPSKPPKRSFLEQTTRALVGISPETIKEIPGIASNVLSTFGFGIPKVVSEMQIKAGVPGAKQAKEFLFPEQETQAGKNIRAAGELGALFLGGSATIARKLGSKIIGSGFRKKALKGAVEGGSFGGTQVFEDELSLKTQAGQAIGGATVGGILGTLAKAKSSIDKATKGAPVFLRKVRGAVFQRKRQASEEFGSQLQDLSRANPNKKVSLRNVIDKINNTAAEEPKLKTLINRTPSAKRLADNPQLADEVPVEEAQRIINDLTAKLPSSKKLGFNVTSDDIAVFDVIDDIRGSQLEAFPEMQQIRQSYSQVINKYNLIKNKIKAGSLQNNLIKDFGDRELKEAFEELVPADILKEAVEFRKIHGALDFTGRVGRRAAEGAAAVGAGGFVGKKIGLFGD